MSWVALLVSAVLLFSVAMLGFVLSSFGAPDWTCAVAGAVYGFAVLVGIRAVWRI